MFIKTQYLCLNVLEEKIVTFVIIDIISKKNYMFYFGNEEIGEQSLSTNIKNFEAFIIETNNSYDFIIKIDHKELLDTFLSLNFKKDILRKNVYSFLSKYNLYEHAI